MACPFNLIDESSNDLGVSSDFFIPSVSDNSGLKQVCARMPSAKYIGSRFVVVSSCIEGSNGDISSVFITVISISMMSSCVKGSIGVISSIFITISVVGMIGTASLFVPDKVAPSGHR